MDLPVPSFLKRQAANEIHAEMIIRLMDALIKEGNLTLEKALQVHYEMGQDISLQVKELLSIDENDAGSLSKIIDFIHDLLFISRKETVENSRERAVSHWHGCSLSGQLSALKEGGPYYCHLYQEMYKGVLAGINSHAKTNDLEITRSQGCEYCRLETWIEE
jgi:polyhydroxyalkanoate synthesis regulator phasin